MSRTVTRDGRGALVIRFPYDARLVDLVKTLPNRRWQASERYWSAPEEDVRDVVELLHGEGFSFDPGTRELYRERGGHLPLDGARASRPLPEPPSLFDRGQAAADTSAGDYTVSRLNEQVRSVLEQAFPVPIWLVGEISGFNKAAHRRHVSFQLVDRDGEGKSVSEIAATVFEGTRRTIEDALAAAGHPFRLEDEVTVRVRARVELYVPWGSYRVVIDALDVSYTLGEAARRREEIIRRLTAAGLAERNTSLPFPKLPLRVGLITSLGSDAHNDVLRTLQESGFAFQVTVHGARVQGRLTAPSVLNALDWFRERVTGFDVVMICRGGGSRTDLAWFDSDPLGRAVATFPLPVLVGIGHEQDHSVLDAVGWRCKTPTAAAVLLVDTVTASLREVERTLEAVLEGALRRIHEAAQHTLRSGGRLARAARARIEQERRELGQLRRRVLGGARKRVDAARREVRRTASAVPRGSSVLIGRAREGLESRVRQLLQGTRRDLASARRRLSLLARTLRPASGRRLDLETERTAARGRRLDLADPRRVVARGYAILRLADRRVVTGPRQAPAGSSVRAELRDGALRLTSEGPEVDEGSTSGRNTR
jgi:exodeoxyribonuclease VII large subunit